MPRTSENEIRDIIESDPTIPMRPFIAAAYSLVNKLETSDTNDILSSSDLKEIETWLAAHYYATRDHGFQSKSTEGASGTFQGQTGMFFKGTFWGQRVLELDTTGYLAKLQDNLEKGGAATATVSWLGKPKSQQTVYRDRN